MHLIFATGPMVEGQTQLSINFGYYKTDKYWLKTDTIVRQAGEPSNSVGLIIIMKK